MSGRINVHIETYGQTLSVFDPWVCSSNSLGFWYLNTPAGRQILLSELSPLWIYIFLGFDPRKSDIFIYFLFLFIFHLLSEIWYLTFGNLIKKIKGKVKGSSNLQKKVCDFVWWDLIFFWIFSIKRTVNVKGFSPCKFSQKVSVHVHIRICSNIKSEFSASKEWEQPISVPLYNDLYLKKSMG